MADAPAPQPHADRSRKSSRANGKPRESPMGIATVKRPTALMLGAGAARSLSARRMLRRWSRTAARTAITSSASRRPTTPSPTVEHVNDELTAAAKKVPQFTLQIADGAGNVNTQTSQMDNFITQKVDLILISPFEAAPLTPVVARAMKAGIPVIELDRKTVGDPGKDYTAFIGGDNYKIAQEAGKYVADKLLPEGGEVAVLEGLPSSTPAVERLNGFKDGVKGNAKIQVVAEQAADWLPDKAQTAFAAMLQAHPNIKAVYASNDMMAAGARLAAKGAGKKDGDIAILGTDGLPGPAGGIGRSHRASGRRRSPTRPADRRRSTWRSPSCSIAPKACRRRSRYRRRRSRPPTRSR